MDNFYIARSDFQDGDNFHAKFIAETRQRCEQTLRDLDRNVLPSDHCAGLERHVRFYYTTETSEEGGEMGPRQYTTHHHMYSVDNEPESIALTRFKEDLRSTPEYSTPGYTKDVFYSRLQENGIREYFVLEYKGIQPTLRGLDARKDKLPSGHRIC